MTPGKLWLSVGLLACACVPPSGSDEGGGESSDMVEIPAGEFWRGCHAALVAEVFDVGCEEGPDFLVQDVPYRAISLATFWIDRYEATIGEYVACVDAGVCEPIATIAPPDISPRDRIALGGLDWFQARTYCEWRDKRLPTEAEWEKAGRGADGRELPWGNEAGADACGYANTRLNFPAGCPDHAAEVDLVDAYPMDRSIHGVVGMAGNLQEWVADWADYDYYAEAPASDPPGPESSSLSPPRRIVRGGYYDALMRLSLRRWLEPETQLYRVGVRCASSVAPSEIADPLASR